MGFKSEFKEFISKGSVMDMAVGIIIGGAFTAIVTSLVEKIIQPIISMLGGSNLEGLGITLPNGGFIDFGAFISAIINFFIVALIVFAMVKAMNKFQEATSALLKKEEEEAEAAAPTCPFCLEEVKEGATRCPHCAGVFDEPAKAK
jgi:large conductance mechanosensitive channel